MRGGWLGSILLIVFATWPGSVGQADEPPPRLGGDGWQQDKDRWTVRLAVEQAPSAARQPPLGEIPRSLSEPRLVRPSGSPVLGLEDLRQIALQSNPTLVQARMAVRAAQQSWLQAGLYPNPTVGYIGDEIGNDGGAGFQGGFVGQEIVTAGKLRLARAVGSHEVQQARYAWDAQQQRVFNDVRAGYYETLLAQRMVETNQQLVRVAEESLKITEKLREAEEVSRTDVLQAEIEAGTAAIGLNDAQNGYLVAWRRLAAVVGRPEMEPAALAGSVDSDLPAFTWESVLQDLLARSPELGLARAGVERARCELAHQCALRIPNVEIGAAVKRDTISGYTTSDVEFGLPLPLFDRNQGNIGRAQANLIAAQQEMRRVELSLQDRLAAGFGQYANAHHQVRVYTDTLLPRAKESLDLVRVGYREGEFDYLDLLTAQRTYFSVNLDYLQSLRDFWIQAVELEGLLLRGGLENASAGE